MEEIKEKLRDVIATECLKFANEHRIVTPSGTTQKDGWLFDFRAILLRPDVLDMVGELFWERFKDKHPFQVGGLEAAAIPMVTAVVMKGRELGYETNGFFIRKERKTTGLQNAIEGTLNDTPIVLVDDLINNGYTFKKQIAVLSEEGRTVKGLFSLLRFRDKSAYKSLPPLFSVYLPEDFGVRLDESQDETNGKPVPMNTGFSALWKFSSEDPNYFYVFPKSRPVIDNDKLYFGADNGTFWALNQEDGSVAWKFRIRHRTQGKAIFSSPAIHDGLVYFGAYDGSMYALDTTTGEKVWEFDEADWIGSSPEIAPDLGLLFVGLEFGLRTKRGGIVALDLKTGEKKWGYYDMVGLTHASPGYSQKHKTVVIGCNDHCVYAFNAKNGTLKWTYKTGGEVKYSIAFDDKRRWSFATSMDGNVYVLDTKKGALVHVFQTNGPIYSTPLVLNDRLYVGSYDKFFYCFDLNTRERAWKFATRGKIMTSPVCINTSIFIGSNDGLLYELDTNGMLLDFFTVRERITNNVVYNPKNKRYFLPTFANEVYCLQKKKAQ